MTTMIVGECGNCGGPVEVPMVWYGIYQPTPACRQCHASARPAEGKTMPMNPATEEGLAPSGRD